MTLQERIENYIGLVQDVRALDGWITTAIRKIYALVPLRFLERITSPVTVPYSGLDVTKFRLASVVCAGVPMVQIPLSFKARAMDPRSIHYASRKEPVFYVENGRLKVLPQEMCLSSTAYVVMFPAASHLSESLGAYVHEEVEHAVVLWVAVHARMRQLNNFLADHVTSLSLPVREIPSSPGAPSFSTGVTHVVSMDPTLLDEVTLDLPEFPLLVMENVPLDISIPEPMQVEPPKAPDYTAIGISPGLLPPPPQELDISSILTALSDAMEQEDIELAQARMNEAKTRVETHYGAYESYLRSLTAASDVERSYVEKLVSDYRARVDAFVAQMNAHVAQVRLGLEYHTARIQVTKTAVDAAVARFQGEVEGALGVYRGKIEAYSARVNMAIQKASLAQARIVELARLEESEAARASQEEALRQVNEYKLALERYGAQVGAYSAGVQSDAQGVIAMAQKAKIDFDGMVLGLGELKAQYAETMQELTKRNE